LSSPNFTVTVKSRTFTVILSSNRKFGNIYGNFENLTVIFIQGRVFAALGEIYRVSGNLSKESLVNSCEICRQVCEIWVKIGSEMFQFWENFERQVPALAPANSSIGAQLQPHP
jgi:hypothetical protein